MKRDTVTLSQFLRMEEQKLKQELIRMANERLRKVHLLNDLSSFKDFRRKMHKQSPKEWPVREHPGDFSQSLSFHVFREW
jgi:hypothetical protein